jgi:GAF domain-containing protein
MSRGTAYSLKSMVFNPDLVESLGELDREFGRRSDSGSTLETVLSGFLRHIESAADRDIRTSVLLLDRERGVLRHGAAPSLPSAYCEAIDGIAIGPSAGSCGTAAYMGHAIFVTDVETDPLWVDFRDLALAHELRSCWSTPIRRDDDEIIGTFAIYHSTARSPTEAEIYAVKDISTHVANAIARCR